MRKLLLLSLATLFLAGQLFAQKTITGKVLDESGDPIPNASVKVKGQNTGVSTKTDGTFSLTVPDKGVLSISSVGMMSIDVSVSGKTEFAIRLLKDEKSMNEVIVTAFGIGRQKKGLSSAVVDVKADQIVQKSEPDLLRSLTGKVPGVTITSGGGAPGQSTKINLRGNTSFTGNNQPLIVVDGVPFDNSVNNTQGFARNTVFSNRLNDIDPNTIESLTILKGANAAALYGERANNGAIIITTKAGSKGNRKGLEITYSTSYNSEKLSSTPDYQDIYGQGSNQNYNGGFIGNFGSPFPQWRDRINTQLGYPRYVQANPGFGQNLAPDSVPNPLVNLPYTSPRYASVFPELVGKNVAYQPYDIVGGFFQPGNVTENSINIASTGGAVSVNAGASRMTNDGIVPNSKTARTTLSFGANAKLSNKMTLSGNVNYVNNFQQSPQSGASFFVDYGSGGDGSSIYARLFYLPRNYNLNAYPFENPIDGSMVFYRALDNPRWIAKNNHFTSTVDRAYGNLALAWDPLKWLNFTSRGGMNTYNDKQTDYVRSGGIAFAPGRYSVSNIRNTELNFTHVATAKHKITSDFDFIGRVGVELNQVKTEGTGNTGVGIIDPNIRSLKLTQTVTNDFDNKTLLNRYGAFADLQFSLKNYLFANITARNDKSSTLPQANNSFFYYSGGLGFVFTDAFEINNSVLNFGKLRLSRAKVGKGTSPYQLATIFSVNPAGGAYTHNNGSKFDNASLGNTLRNPNLMPELTFETELGLDLRFFQDRITLDVTAYKKKSINQIIAVTVPASSGFTSRVINAGEVGNKGLEIGLTVEPIRTQNFSWTTSFAFTKVVSTVVDAGPTGELFLGGAGLTGTGTIHRAGQPFGMIFGTKFARDSASGSLLIDEASGRAFPLPQSGIIGNPMPDFNLGINNTFKYKNFSFSFLIDWKEGGDMYSSTAGSLLLRGQLNNKYSVDREGVRIIPGVYGNPQTFKAILDNGKLVKNTTGVTAFDYHFSNGYGAYGADEVNVYDATVIRLREVSLGWEVPKKALAKTPFGTARFSLSGRNLWFRAPNMLEGLNFDPEVLSSFADSNVQGFDLGAAPSTRRIGINLTLTF